MTIENKGNYVVIDNGKAKYSIAKGAIIVTQSEDSVQLRLNGNRQVLVSFPKSEIDADTLIGILY